ncbi:hypothetical protein N7535_005362 [Penicillium sp. DV-2018c]|nr:hypothetical protein N7461_008943 [Penicillium sp. DV-2018c]KAJ5571702.1 hypothetical protein N7535_005362 [Penicillium sp. DV-2018c]
MSTTVSIYARRHLRRRGSTGAEKLLLHVKGSDGRFHYEPETKDARRSKSLVELLYLCDVEVAKTSSIKTIASKITVHNEIRGWNCQDYVLDLLDALEDGAIVDNQDADYREQKSLLRGKQEGLM